MNNKRDTQYIGTNNKGNHNLSILSSEFDGGKPKLESQSSKVIAPIKGRYVLITGGAGFIGTNVAHRLLSEGHRVMIYDNLTRAGVERNLQWLIETHGNMVEPVIANIRDETEIRRCVRQASHVFHFAAQVAVTTSLNEPIADFEVNALGTLTLLEVIRSISRPIPLAFTSTNKVYGSLDDVEIRALRGRYEPVEASLRMRGVSEIRPLDFHSPYGCSKGAADQYVRDYARSYGLPTVVFRMSCIYGPHQFGTEDQGWIAHFLIRALKGEPVVIYGDGRQVRDILFVEDLVNAFLLAQANIERLSGRAFNIGGGPANTISLLDLLSFIRELQGHKPEVHFGEWRVGDQKYYVSDTSAFRHATGWSPSVSVAEGVGRLRNWLAEAYLPKVEAVSKAHDVNGKVADKRYAPGMTAPVWGASEVVQ